MELLQGGGPPKLFHIYLLRVPRGPHIKKDPGSLGVLASKQDGMPQ